MAGEEGGKAEFVFAAKRRPARARNWVAAEDDACYGIDQPSQYSIRPDPSQGSWPGPRMPAACSQRPGLIGFGSLGFPRSDWQKPKTSMQWAVQGWGGFTCRPSSKFVVYLNALTHFPMARVVIVRLAPAADFADTPFNHETALEEETHLVFFFRSRHELVLVARSTTTVPASSFEPPAPTFNHGF
ncbi:hypothetical protein BCR34DRAFT_602973 [Clohesyomyces aquaticus]|uniref:Uncharacterized protein n=1 Tax=Clohesyomyces aquaticus TaxID=1231657 RepID=A0A1Y1ZGE6_9PLEO|nr:hypothetical protein BCR34DRAFT_602973 [Clohesyomyces aquaticus]